MGRRDLALGLDGQGEEGTGLRRPRLSSWDKDPSLMGLRQGKQDIRGGGGHIKDNVPSMGLPLAGADKALSVLFRAKLSPR